ncbi:hypothetical protein FGO68_gene7632 [Halteria grandinella]|uniref:Uncharacterized protein n=1 Tax=Halteria grandinella TaxID=5974 RepID=A0A8J8T031_HALGN|nr:hypothetical protein FGO68_gene7632 [Halteria grandinella]
MSMQALELEAPTRKLTASSYNDSIYRFGPLVSVCYLAANVYTFAGIFNLWNNFNILMIAFSGVHLVVPVYTFVLSLDYNINMQTVVYYFASTVKSIANGLIFMETAALLLAFFTKQLTESTSFAVRADNLITNMVIVLVPFLVMTGFLHYEVALFRKEHAPQDHTLYATRDGKKSVERSVKTSDEDSIVLVVIDDEV